MALSNVQGVDKKEVNIFKDECKEDKRSGWITNDRNSAMILDLGCVSKLTKVYMKNIDNPDGGTNKFSLCVGNFKGGPWTIVLKGNLQRSISDGCSKTLYTFNMDP